MTMACKGDGNFEAVEYALKKFPDRTVELANQVKGTTRSTPLFTLAHFGQNVAIMRLLIAAHADPFRRSKGGCSFFHSAIFGARDAKEPGLVEKRRQKYRALAELLDSEEWDEHVRENRERGMSDEEFAEQMQACKCSPV